MPAPANNKTQGKHQWRCACSRQPTTEPTENISGIVHARTSQEKAKQ
jgi:hypothetical protein